MPIVHVEIGIETMLDPRLALCELAHPLTFRDTPEK
jgi:hypothetical protein